MNVMMGWWCTLRKNGQDKGKKRVNLVYQIAYPFKGKIYRSLPFSEKGKLDYVLPFLQKVKLQP